MDFAALEKLNELKEKGILTEEEFQAQKAKILSSGNDDKLVSRDISFSKEDSRNYAALMHCSQLLGFIIPILGLLVPVGMWLYRKDQDDYVNRQGKVLLNWIVTELICAIVCWMLIFLLIGIPLLIVLVIVSIVFAIKGALRARDGVVQDYPFAIKFFTIA